MDLKQSHDELANRIREFAARQRDAKQVAERLEALLPKRLTRLKATKGTAVESKRASASRAERLALTQDDYLEHLNELSNIRKIALESRISFETHYMLFRARQSRKSRLQRTRASQKYTKNRG